jgi:hypothetical protein
MADEQPTIAAPELASPAIEAPVTTEETTPVDEPERILSPEEASEEQQPEELAPVEDETIEIDWDDGKKYTIPKAIEAGILKNKDYTTKTQEAAALRKQLESREAEITQKLEATEAELDARAELRSVSAQLAEYEKLTPQDWQQHYANDPYATQQAKLMYDTLKEQKAALQGKVTQAQSERSTAAQQALAKRVQDTVAEAPKIIPGWTPETGQKTITELVAFAQSEGIPDQVLEANWSPQLLKLLHRAHLGHNLLTKQATAPKPAPTVVPQPLQTVAGTKSAPTSGDLGSLDMEAYVAARKKGVGGKPLR